MRIRIVNLDKATGGVSNGYPFNQQYRPQLEELAKCMDALHPSLIHWVESEPQEGWTEETTVFNPAVMDAVISEAKKRCESRN